MAAKLDAPFFVVNEHGVSIFRAFKTEIAACVEAKRLAEKEQGVAVYVVRAVQSYIVPKPDVVVIHYGE